MVTPQFIEEKPIGLVEVKDIITEMIKRDTELNFRSNKVKDYMENFENILSSKKKGELHAKLSGLNLIRLKEEHLIKIIDFLPTTANDLKIVLQAYPLSLAKKDQEAIAEVVKEFTST